MPIRLVTQQSTPHAGVVAALKQCLREAEAGNIDKVHVIYEEAGPNSPLRYSQAGPWPLAHLAHALAQAEFDIRLELCQVATVYEDDEDGGDDDGDRDP